MEDKTITKTNSKIGEKKNSEVGLNAMLSFDATLLLNGDTLSKKDVEKLLSYNENLVFFKGLGNVHKFKDSLKKNDNNFYSSLRSLISPYILRRLKSDKKIINDLPDKVEIKTYCSLSKTQIALYQNLVLSLAKDIATAEGIERLGIIGSYLMRFKQLCNHPAHLIKNGNFSEEDSGKFLKLKEIAEIIFAKQEKVLYCTDPLISRTAPIW